MIFIRKIKQILPIVQHYSTALILAMGTSVFGFLLMYNVKNVIERVVLFPDGTSTIAGASMLALGILKFIFVFERNMKIKKYILIAITLCWLTISWSYMVNQTQNTGSVMALMITGICYLELYRGDYSD